MLETNTGDIHLPARKVWERYGITDVTLWRWLRDPKLNFPPPIKINRRRYWKISVLQEWEKSQEAT